MDHTSRVIVLKNDFSILGTTTFKKAIRLIVKEKAVIVAESTKKIHDNMFAPLVIRLVKAIRNLWRVRIKIMCLFEMNTPVNIVVIN